jgi:hypothetical protein
MEDLIHVIYLGAASPDLSEHDTVNILNDARKTNRSHDISGLMLYVGGCLLLLLEGEPAKVDSASRAIVTAERDLRMILREPISEREFPEWIMGFETVEPLEAARLLGDPTCAKTLLSIIGRRRWQSDRSGMFRAIRRTAK